MTRSGRSRVTRPRKALSLRVDLDQHRLRLAPPQRENGRADAHRDRIAAGADLLDDLDALAGNESDFEQAPRDGGAGDIADGGAGRAVEAHGDYDTARALVQRRQRADIARRLDHRGRARANRHGSPLLRPNQCQMRITRNCIKDSADSPADASLVVSQACPKRRQSQ